MKKLLFVNLLILCSLVLSIPACKQLQQMSALSNCEFRLNSIEILSIDNIDVSRINKPEDLDIMTITRLGAVLLSGNMPLTYRANIEAKNPNQQKAAISRMSVEVLFNDLNLAQMNIDRHVEVLPGKTTLIPIQITSDIAQFVRNDNINAIIGLLFTGEDIPSVFTFKIKPSVRVGHFNIDYPGFITLKKDFRAR